MKPNGNKKMNSTVAKIEYSQCALLATKLWTRHHGILGVRTYKAQILRGNKKGAENWDLQRDLRPKSEIAKVKKSNFYCFLATNEP